MSEIRNIMEMTWKEVESLPKEKTVLLVTLAPIEEHGLHLPLGVDIFEGKKWEEDCIRRLANVHPGFNFLFMPVIPLAHGCIGHYPGNFHFRQKTIRIIMDECLKNFVGWGMRYIIILASHGNPRFQIAIEEACQRINRKYGRCAFSPLGAFFSYQELKLDLKFPTAVEKQLAAYPNDFHAGWVETSMMLDIHEGMVGDYSNQPDTDVLDRELMFPKKVEKKIAGFGHIGSPRQASRSLGRELNDHISEFLTQAISAFIKGSGFEKYTHHFLFRIPFLRTYFIRNLLITVAGIMVLLAIFVYYR